MSKTVVITGANRGIGLAMVKQFVSQGDTVFALCRASSEQLNALGVNVIEGVNVATTEGINVMVAALDGVSIDLLVCNAGILCDEQLGDLNLDTIREQFEVNAIAPINVADKLQAQINQGGKIAMITSRMGSIEDNGSGGRYGYRMSKAALNIASVSLAKDLADREIAVGIFHPGYVQTDMVGGRGDISADHCAEKLVGLMNELTMAESGVFKHSNGQSLPW